MALVMPTNQITVAIRLSQSGSVSEIALSNGSVIVPIFTPCDHTAEATAICRASRGMGGNCSRSSLRPMAKKANEPKRLLQIRTSRLAGMTPKPPASQVMNKASEKPSTMPTPPSRTIGVRCCLRGSGLSVRPQRSPSRSTCGTIAAVRRPAPKRLASAGISGLVSKVNSRSLAV